MINNNRKNSGCGFAEELVSYLYGETDAAENPAFEKHLANCSTCADELAAFTGVHFSINEWKSNEFANLPTPVIEIPYSSTSTKQEVSGNEVSWFDKVRNLFTPSWSLASAAMAILAICVGLIFYASKTQTSTEVAGRDKNPKIQVSPSAEKSPAQTNANNQSNALPDKESKSVSKPGDPQPQLAVEQNSKNNRAVKTLNTPRRAQKVETTTTNLPKNEDAKRDNKKKNEIPPKIFEDEEEDDTLRLAEMLEEIDTIE